MKSANGRHASPPQDRPASPLLWSISSPCQRRPAGHSLPPPKPAPPRRSKPPWRQTAGPRPLNPQSPQAHPRWPPHRPPLLPHRPPRSRHHPRRQPLHPPVAQSPQGQRLESVSPEQHGVESREHPAPARLRLRPRPGLCHGPAGLVGRDAGGWSGKQARLVRWLIGGGGFHRRPPPRSHLVCRPSWPLSKPRLGVADDRASPSTGLVATRIAGDQQGTPMAEALTPAQPLRGHRQHCLADRPALFRVVPPAIEKVEIGSAGLVGSLQQNL